MLAAVAAEQCVPAPVVQVVLAAVEMVQEIQLVLQQELLIEAAVAVAEVVIMRLLHLVSTVALVALAL
jgi:hypothetical protein